MKPQQQPQPQQRITEQINPLSIDLDIVGPVGIVRILRQCDAQIFSGWSHFPSLNDEEIISILESIKSYESVWFHPRHGDTKDKIKVIVALAGAGTSGRLAFHCARIMNTIAEKKSPHVKFHYLIAGGDLALIKSQENAEDNPYQAVSDLQKILSSYEDFEHLIYVGISCGLTAPYVAGQIDWILDQCDEKTTTILIGFNEVERSGTFPIEGWNKSFYQVAKRLESRVGDGRHFILNPIVGPEPLTGSTRMKSGTATKILLDVLFGMLFNQSCSVQFSSSLSSMPSSKHSTCLSFRELFLCYETTIRETYYHIPQIASLIDKAGRALCAGCHVYYVGAETLGLMSIIDASECPPTFGAEFSDVRGFVVNGWNTLQNVAGDLSAVGSSYQLSHSDFIRLIVPTLSSNDFVVFLLLEGQPFESLLNCLILTRQTCSNIQLIYWPQDRNNFKSIEVLTTSQRIEQENVLCVPLTYHFLMETYPAFVELSAKLILNAISTGAHILRGKVFKNRMIDLTISNNKLYHRALSLLQELASLTPEESVNILLRSIYQVDTVSEEIKNLPVSAHIEKASQRHKVLPLAFLLASQRFQSVNDAQQSLQKNPIVRSVVSDFSFLSQEVNKSTKNN